MPDLTLNPCTGCVAQSAYSKLLLSSDSADFTKSGGLAYRLYFLGENIKKYVRKRDIQRIIGNLWRVPESVFASQSLVYGTVYFAMNAGEMAVLAPYLVGALASGSGESGDYEPDSCPSAFHLLILRDYGIFKVTTCHVASWRVDSRSLQFREDSLADMVVLAVNVIAADRTLYTDDSNWPVGDEPDLGTTAAYNPYFFRWSTLTMRTSVDYSAYCKSVRLVVDKKVMPRYRMSSTPSQFCSMGRDVDLEVGLDWNSTTKALIEQATDLSGSVKFANDESATCSTQFNFSSLIAVDEDPVSPNKTSDVEWSVKNIAAADDPDNDEFDITITNDATV